MRTLKDLIHQWLTTTNKAHTARLSYYQERHNLLLKITDYKLERESLITANWTQDDKDIVNDFYTRQIDKLKSDVYWLDLFYELNVTCI